MPTNMLLTLEQAIENSARAEAAKQVEALVAPVQNALAHGQVTQLTVDKGAINVVALIESLKQTLLHARVKEIQKEMITGLIQRYEADRAIELEKRAKLSAGAGIGEPR